jgi:GntR family transcriptional regulator
MADAARPSPRAIPAYLAIADALSARIADMEVGARLPSENEIAAEENISHMTARSALLELERRHLVRRVRGSGTYVARRIQYQLHMGMPHSWSQMIRDAGGEPFRRVLHSQREAPSAAIADLLGIRGNETVVRYDQLGTVDGLVSDYATSWLRGDLVSSDSDFLEDGASMYQALRNARVDPVVTWAAAELAVVPAHIAGDLELEGRPLIWRTTILACDQETTVPISFHQSWLRPDIYKMRLLIGDPGNANARNEYVTDES